MLSGRMASMGNADDDAWSSAAELNVAALTDSELTTRIDELERRLAAAPEPAGQDEAHDLIRRKRSAGELRWERFGRSGDLADAQQAWLAVSGAVDTWMESPLPRSADPELYAALCYDLAVILQVQALLAPGGTTVAEPITALESAVKAAPGHAGYRAALASALLDSAAAGGDRQQFLAMSDRAIELFREVVPAAPGADPDARAAAQCDLAATQVAKFTRALGVDDMVLQVLATSDLDEAIDVLGEAAATAGLSAGLRTRVARDYARAVSLRATRDQHLQPKLSPAAARTLPIVQSGKLSRAEELLHDLITDGDRSGDTAQLLVDLLLKDWELCRRPEALTAAEAVARDAVAASAPAAGGPVTEAAAGAELALARVLAARPMDATGPDLAGPTSAAFQAACDGYQQLADASGVITASRQWAAWGMALARWPDAAEAFGREAAGVQAEIRAAGREREVFAGLKTMTGVASDAAFARALAGDSAAAIEGLESDRAMFYRALLADAGRGTALGGTVADLTARFPDTALVFLVPASVGGIALIAAPGEPPHAELLPELTAAAVEVNIGKFWGALTARQWRASDSVTVVIGNEGIEDLTPQPELDALTSWLWTAAMRRVIQLAGRWPRIALIPTGRLVSAPLHAAWRPDPSAVTGRRYALDDALIGYLPTAGLGPPLGPASLPEHARLLVVADPSPCSAPPLSSAAAEAAAAAGVFPDVTSLAGGQATREHVLAALPAHGIAHLICHGRSDPEKPLDTHLLLSNDEHLSVGDLIDRDLSALRLAVLSACESASPSTHLPEAAISLPAALLAAGVSGVVGTLWEAADAPTSVLMARFYQALREPADGSGLAAPAQALRAAQRWVRDTTNSEKEAALPGLVDFGPNPVGSRLTALRAKARTPMLHWAGFLYAGR
jgi:CHAT domain